jgi:hypothetical protein
VDSASPDATPEDPKSKQEKSQKKKDAINNKFTDYLNLCKLQWSVTSDEQGLRAWIVEAALRNVEVGTVPVPVCDWFVDSPMLI